MSPSQLRSPDAPPRRVMLVEDDATLRRLLADQIRTLGHLPEPVGSCAEAAARVEAAPPDLMLVDMRLPDGDGFSVLDRFGDRCPLIFLTAFGSVDQAVRAVHAGALDYLIKPVSAQTLELALNRAFDTLEMRRDLKRWQTQARREAVNPVLGQSDKATRIQQLIALYAPADSPVLIQGESGTGKETVARAIHDAGPRADARFVAVDCDSGDEAAMAAELFGQDPGTPGATDQAREGMIEVASGGTLYLNDIADLSLALQARLLRVMESGVFRHGGGAQDHHVDLRIIAASRQDLAALVEEGAFRPELYYHLAAFALSVPPLRARPGDIPSLAAHFIAERDFQRERDKRLSDAAEEALRAYDWPGNLRELRNAVERGLIMSGTADEIGPEHLSLPGHAAGSLAARRAIHFDYDSPPTLEALRDDYLRLLLERFEGNRVKVAKTMGISERNTYRLLKKLDTG